MANTKEGTVQIAGAGTNPESNQKLYDDWAPQYEQDVRGWGYNMPEICAEILKAHIPAGNEASCKVLDAGAGDGLSGKALVEQGFTDVTGVDLSPELVKIAQDHGIYTKAEVADLSQPLQFVTDEFDALTVVGVMTYLEPDGCSLAEFCRVVRPGGLVVMTHRTDKAHVWNARHQQLIEEGKWEEIAISDEYPYLPNNPEYGEDIKVIVYVFRVCDEPTILKEPEATSEHLPAGTYQIAVQKTDQVSEIGADLVPTAGRILQIQAIHGGLLYAWNLANPGRQVLPGDFIVSVNGAAGSVDAILQEVGRSTTLIIYLTRFARPAGGLGATVPPVITYTYLDYSAARFVKPTETMSQASTDTADSAVEKIEPVVVKRTRKVCC